MGFLRDIHVYSMYSMHIDVKAPPFTTKLLNSNQLPPLLSKKFLDRIKMHQVIESKESHLPTVSTHLVLLGIQTHMFLSQSEQGISSTFFTTSLFLQAIRELRYPQVYRQHSNDEGQIRFSFR